MRMEIRGHCVTNSSPTVPWNAEGESHLFGGVRYSLTHGTNGITSGDAFLTAPLA